ncbi:WD40 domain-containing protein [Bythopirellula goksoeyrii]|uniref:Serine/threonine-protein kinase PknD n=1 Tax=Bythopirellula goksoeyrii TaxID=1400387 RepID=A0A5B9QFW1_9BACT|nr:protein kinase [Bythopirellula goksoeyrii]QEG36789.1 Serine/threonine-protein kinase PknD [Bythopirellula goksoeyrii]
MRTCPACQTVADEKAIAAQRCSKCGAALHRVPKRTISDIAHQGTVSPQPPLDLDTIGELGSIDIPLVGDTNDTPDTIRTVDLSSLPSDESSGDSSDEPPVREKPKTVPLSPEQTIEFSSSVDPPSGKKPKTVPIGPEQTIEFLPGVSDPSAAESLATAQWQGSMASSVDNERFTIKQKDTTKDSDVKRSSVVVKSRQFREKSDSERPVFSETDAPDYELLDQIGEGGMGVVYSAKQSAIARTVAVKMLKKKDADDASQREKFISEAVVTGELDHPNIVPIYDLGSNDSGALFYSMKRVKGTPWDDVLKKRSLDENLSILLRAADAVAFAHANGVIHRDLKPENIMLGDYGEVLVMDWGLARISPNFPNASSVSQSDVMGGTPAYMSPEMATGPIELVTPASDVYLLGAMLYEIVTGKTPHTGKTVMACLMAAAKNQIPVIDHPNELSDIALKAMATKPADRYQSVQEFQAAIRQYQSHSESILLTDSAEKNLRSAKEAGDYELFSRALYGFEEALSLWNENKRAKGLLSSSRMEYASTALGRGDYELGVTLLDPENAEHRPLLEQLQAGLKERASRGRRLALLKKMVAALLLAVVGIVSVAYVFVRAERDEAVVQRVRAEDAEGVAQENYREAESARQVAETQRQIAVKERTRAEEQRQIAVTQRNRAETEEAKALEAKQAEEYEAYVARIGLANAKIEENAFDRAQTLLDECNPALTNWEWGRLSYLCNLSNETWQLGGPVEAVAYSPSGKNFASGDLNGKVTLWDASSGEELHTLDAGQYVHGVAFDPTGERLAVGSSDNKIRIYRVSDGQLLSTLEGHTDAVLSVQFSEDGGQLLSAGYDNTARLWDVTSGEVLQTLQGHNWWVWSAQFSPDGRRIVTASQDGKAIVWEQADEEGPYVESTQFTQHRGPVYAARFSPDGSQIATAGYDRRVLLWNPEKVHPPDIARRLDSLPDLPSPFVELGIHEGPVRGLSFAPDGETLASGGQDNVVRIWQLASGTQVAQLRGHASHVRDCVFSPDGESLLSAGRDAQVKLWQPQRYAEMVVLEEGPRGEADAVLAASFSRDGEEVVTAGRDRTSTLWSVADRKPLQHFAEGHEFLASIAQFFDDGSRLATGAGDSTVRIWDVATGTELQVLEGTGYTAALAVSPDGRWIASGGAENELQIWDANTGQPIISLAGHEAPVTSLSFSSDSNMLASGDDRGRILLWQRDPQSGNWSITHQLSGHSRSIVDVAFAQGDRLLVSASGDNTCGIWDVATGTELRDRVLKHPEWINAMDVSDDGTQVLTSCDDGRVRLWSVDDAELLSTFSPAGEDVVYTAVDLSPDGSTALVTCAATGKVYLWDLTSQEEIGPESSWLDLGKGVWAASFAPSGESLITIGGNDARLWDVDSRKQLVSFSPHGAVADADVSPDGQWIVTGSWDQSAKIWDVQSGKAIRKLEGVHEGYVNSVQFSPDGKQVLTASDDSKAQLWDAATGKPLDPALVGHEDRVRQARFSSDGSRIVTASNDKTSRVWDTDSAQEQLVLRGHEWAVLCGEFSQDGTRIITGSEDNVAIVWDATTGEQILKLPGHTDSVTAVAFSPDGTRALTGSQDNTVKLWDAQTGKEILTLEGHREAVTSVSFSPDGQTVLSSGRDGQTILWPATHWDN